MTSEGVIGVGSVAWPERKGQGRPGLAQRSSHPWGDHSALPMGLLSLVGQKRDPQESWDPLSDSPTLEGPRLDLHKLPLGQAFSQSALLKDPGCPTLPMSILTASPRPGPPPPCHFCRPSSPESQTASSSCRGRGQRHFMYRCPRHPPNFLSSTLHSLFPAGPGLERAWQIPAKMITQKLTPALKIKCIPPCECSTPQALK